MKNSIKKITLFFLFVTSLILLLTAFSSVFADETQSYTLTVNYENENWFQKSSDGKPLVELVVKGKPQMLLSNGEIVSVPSLSEFTLSVHLETGYQLKGFFDANGLSLSQSSNSIVSPQIQEDMVVNIVCEPISYTLKYASPLDTSGKTLEYTYGDGPKTITYMGDDVALPTPSINGYTFVKWLYGTEAKEVMKESGVYTLFANSAPSYADGTVITLTPVFEPKMVTVFRYDYEYNPSNPKGRLLSKTPITFQASANSEVTGLMGDDASYSGYYFVNDTLYYSTTTARENDEAHGNFNEVYRYYLPCAYSIQFGMGARTSGTLPSSLLSTDLTYVFNCDFDYDVPTVEFGYTFTGWKVSVNGKQVCFIPVNESHTIPAYMEEIATFEGIADKRDAKPTKLYFEAQWQTDSYSISYTLNGGSCDGLPSSYVFDTTCKIPNPTRPGYTFSGWTVYFVETDETFTGKIGYSILAKNYHGAVTLTATWTPITYRHIAVYADAENKKELDSFDATFDSRLSKETVKCPSAREGYTFLGFYNTPDDSGKRYFDENGAVVTDVIWTETAESPVLYGVWKRNYYPLTLTISGDANAVVTVIDSDGTRYSYVGEPILLPYQLSFTVSIKSSDGYKITAIDGDRLSMDLAVYSIDEVLMPLNGKDISVTICATSSSPLLTASAVSYPNETITLPIGTFVAYYVVSEELCGFHTFQSDGSPIEIPNEYFGETVYFHQRGDGVSSADSLPVSLTFAKRPIAVIGATGCNIPTPGNDGTVHFSCPSDGNEYFFSIDGGDFTKEINYTGWVPGASYLVTVKIGATQTAPEGETTSVLLTVPVDSLIETESSGIEKLKADYSGEFCVASLENALLALRNLRLAFENNKENYNAMLQEYGIPSDEKFAFSNAVQKIVTDTKNGLSLESKKDAYATKIREYLYRFKDSGKYSETEIATLTLICNNAISSMKNISDENALETDYQTTLSEMDAVGCTILQTNIGELKANGKFTSKATANLDRIEDFDAESISELIDSGKVYPSSSCTLTATEAQSQLKTLEILGYYSFTLSDGNSTGFDYTLSIDISSDLKTSNHLYIAFYDQDSGQLELVKAEVTEGKLLIYGDRISDFVVFGDYEMDLSLLMIVLILIALLLLVILGFVLYQRKKQSALYSFAPVFLTVKTVPTDAMAIVIFLGIVIFLLSGILLFVLIFSRGKYQKPEPKAEKKNGDSPESEEINPEETEQEEKTDKKKTPSFLDVLDEIENTEKDAQIKSFEIEPNASISANEDGTKS